jgi:hypothetical protein
MDAQSFPSGLTIQSLREVVACLERLMTCAHVPLVVVAQGFNTCVANEVIDNGMNEGTAVGYTTSISHPLSPSKVMWPRVS